MTRYLAKLLAAILISTLSPWASMAQSDIIIDEKLLRESDYLDIAYINGKFAYLVYQTPESLYSSINPALNASPIIATIATRPSTATKTAVWLWEYNKVIGHEDTTLEKLTKSGISKIYLQIDRDNLESLRPFVSKAISKKIEVFALDGKPADIDDFSDLIQDVEAIEKFNSVDKNVIFTGFQADVEPYIKPDFNLNPKYYAYRYITLINKLKMSMGDKLKLSVAIPFWYDTVIIDGVPFSNRVIDNVDEVAIMSYRTQYSEILASAANELEYAKTANKPVYLGIETTHIDDEKHFVIEANTAAHYLEHTISGKTVLSVEPEKGLPVYKIYYVKADMITFEKRKSDVAKILKQQPDISSFAGYAIHSYESYIRDSLFPVPNHKDYGIIIDL